jgi:FkbH-like protein
MKLIEAFDIVRRNDAREAPEFSAYLACGFNPLHLPAFLAAELSLALPERRVVISQGLFGDFWGNLEKAAEKRRDSIVVILDWADLDPRLGLRGLGSWAPASLSDILLNVRNRVAQFVDVLKRIAGSSPTVVCFPTLTMQPVSYFPGSQASSFELELRQHVSTMNLQASRIPNVRIVSDARLDQLSPRENRHDVKSDVLFGYPYKLPHASVIAKLTATLIQPPPPKKGLITDLDDTLWKGILGEDGVGGISWDLDNHSHMHGVYQRFLQSLSETGILIGAASKNAPESVAAALEREDLILPSRALFPVEANWGMKSESVKRILKTWNIGPDAIVFIDDSPMELAEVKAVHPGIECILFPRDNPQEISELLYRLRDLFGKNSILEEDLIRSQSIRRSREIETHNSSAQGYEEEFLRQSEAELTFSFVKSPLDPRALELVNKTNQFNLNGKRYTEAAWSDYVNQSDTIILMAAYRDKYGPLGKIAVLAGKVNRERLSLDVWVMSCRAFSRRIEHKCLGELFKKVDVEEIEFDYEPTPKNGPITGFLFACLGKPPQAHCRLRREKFEEHRFETFQRVSEAVNG